MTGVQKLLAMEGGSPTKVAAKLTTATRPCSRQLVEYWIKHKHVTPKWVLAVNKAYGIPLYELNPTIYPKAA